MKTFGKILLLAIVQCCFINAFSQVLQKKVEHVAHTWVSINSIFFLNKQWFIMADAHLRENNLFQSNSFYFGRIGLGYQFDKNLSVAAGYATLLSSPTTAGWSTKSDEHRIYQQIVYNSAYKNKVNVLHRLRNEQRWQDIIENDKKTGNKKFSNRVRYLLSTSLQIFKSPNLPQLVLADELLVQFGKDVLYNTFDQNRIFIGIKQKITNNLSFDAGYMQVFQQKSTGINYMQSNTARLFFYYTVKNKHADKNLHHKVLDGQE